MQLFSRSEFRMKRTSSRAIRQISKTSYRTFKPQLVSLPKYTFPITNAVNSTQSSSVFVCRIGSASCKEKVQCIVAVALHCSCSILFVLNTTTFLFPANKFPDKKKASRIAQDLRDKGHNVTEDVGVAEVNALSYYQEKIAAHADSRRGGAQGSAQY